MKLLVLPEVRVRDRVSVQTRIPQGKAVTVATLEGAGCIRHIHAVVGSNPLQVTEVADRTLVLRIYFDDSEHPYVESPVADFFGVMHGEVWYPVDTHYLAVKAWGGLNSYFEMPFSSGARVEVQAGGTDVPFYLQIDWERFPNDDLAEKRRFCAAWRRQQKAESYGRDFLVLGADGPGDLVGFAYGLRLADSADRWSHGGAENLYIDGLGEWPAYIRGIGGEDAFGLGYGGAMYPTDSGTYAGMPFYRHDDVGEARLTHRVVGLRFYERDPVHFDDSMIFRFGSMANDIRSVAYWYSEHEPSPFAGSFAGEKIRTDSGGVLGLLGRLATSGEWWVCGPFGPCEPSRIHELMQGVVPDPRMSYDAGHTSGSLWLTADSVVAGVDRARWQLADSEGGFLDFNHYFRPRARGVAVTDPAVGVAICEVESPREVDAELRVGWDDHLIVQVGSEIRDFGVNTAFRAASVPVSLRQGRNRIAVTLSNSRGSNHGGWTFSFNLRADGRTLRPQLPLERPDTGTSE